MKRYPKSSFSGVAIDYARRVLSGKQPACIQVKQAAQRFIDDFERTDIRFAEDRVDSVCNFVENLVHVKAEWAGTPIKLEPFQAFLLANIFGWLDVATGYRRFRQAFILLPRKNGKSLLAAAIALYMIFTTGEQGAEGYSGATSLDQANEVFGPAKKMVAMTPGLAEALDIETAARSIYPRLALPRPRLLESLAQGRPPRLARNSQRGDQAHRTQPKQGRTHAHGKA